MNSNLRKKGKLMKKLLAFLLSATMVCSTVVTASAVGPSSAETTVT